MITPIDQLTLSLNTSKGTTALLLGSGISRSAQIPTGWEILNELIKRVAGLAGASPSDDDLTKWFTDTFKAEASYSNVLEKIAPTPTERMLVIKSFFEPSIEPRTMQPTDAHKAIASLVKQGYFRVIITTNFDRLLEQALSAEGVHATVISSEDDISGAMPLVHSPCTIIKVNGDYLDARIRNTSGELEKYDDRLTNLLTRVCLVSNFAISA